MSYEMDLGLKSRAEKLLETTSSLYGPDYLNSKIRKVLHRGLAATTFPIWGFTAGLEGLMVYADDRKWPPYVNLGLKAQGNLLKKDLPWFKVRTMIPGAESLEHDYVDGMELNQVKGVKPDPRITRAGKLIRASHTDDLPLLLNVLAGDVYLTGTRKPALSEWQKITDKSHVEPFSEFIELLRQEKVQFGITGMFIVFRDEASQSLTTRIALETMWTKCANLKAELRIIASTMGKVIQPSG